MSHLKKTSYPLHHDNNSKMSHIFTVINYQPVLPTSQLKFTSSHFNFNHSSHHYHQPCHTHNLPNLTTAALILPDPSRLSPPQLPKPTQSHCYHNSPPTNTTTTTTPPWLQSPLPTPFNHQNLPHNSSSITPFLPP